MFNGIVPNFGKNTYLLELVEMIYSTAFSVC